MVVAVAVDAFGGETLIDPTRVALGAVEGGVGSNERKARVVEAHPAPAPVGRAVTKLTIGGKPGGEVVRVIRVLVVPEVAGDAIRWRAALESTARVTGVAVESGVGAGEGNTGGAAVIPVDGGPRGRPVALLAVGPERRAVSIVLAPDPVAVVAGGRGRLDLTVEVTLGARNRQVTALEGHQSILVKRPRCALEGSECGVAGRAVGTERALVDIVMAGGAVIAGRIGEGQLAIVFDARRGSEVRVTALAVDTEVFAQKELSIVLMRVAVDREVCRAVTTLAGGAQLAAVGIFVARDAGVGHPGVTNRRAVARGEIPGLVFVAGLALDLRMLAGQGEVRPAVVEECGRERRFVDRVAVGAVGAELAQV